MTSVRSTASLVQCLQQVNLLPSVELKVGKLCDWVGKERESGVCLSAPCVDFHPVFLFVVPLVLQSSEAPVYLVPESFLSSKSDYYFLASPSAGTFSALLNW